ncbi:uncharacterized protein VTP21DRAFT_7464 [Calcarisporiella thermophila]|uniref:uncharacterized protein n=1 Tax=Calcarisporiella thermophila TaxID=911321 RepID=UPI0037430D70
MIDNGRVRPSKSPWAAPLNPVKKADEATRMAVDYRRLNEVTKKDRYPLPNPQDYFSHLRGAKVFSTIDLASGFWQIELEEADKEKTAFTSPLGLYEFNVMPFGLTNDPATFQRMIDAVCTGMKWNFCMPYMDDLLVFSATVEEHIKHLTRVFEALVSGGLKLKRSKCKFFRKEVKYLGHVIGENGISTDPEKTKAITEFLEPTNLTEVRRSYGLLSYYRRFIRNFSQLQCNVFRWS